MRGRSRTGAAGRGLAGLLAVLALALAACDPPPAAGPPQTQKPTPTPTPLPLPSSSVPVLGLSKPVLGVDLYALSNYPAAEVRTDGQRVLSYIKTVLKADAVGIVWNFFAPGDSSAAVQSTRDTLSARNVAILTRIADSYGLQVEYRPVILVPRLQNPWSGKILPGNPVRWFDNYYRAELPYLRAAQRLGVREFVAQTEMHSLNDSPFWQPFLAKAAKVYHGVLSYADWDGDYFGTDPGAPVQAGLPNTHFLPPPYLGMDMYWHTQLRASASQTEVTQAWAALFSKAPPAILRRTAIDEMGIQARVGAYRDPPALDQPGRGSDRVQARWFTAACATVARFRMRGVFFWKVDLTDNPSHPATSLSTFEGRKAATAISACARVLH
jgi:hypothetical protein